MSEVDPTASTDQLRAAEKRRAAAAIADAANQASREQLEAQAAEPAEKPAKKAASKPAAKKAASSPPKGRSAQKLDES